MIVGFTGTRWGMTGEQSATVLRLLNQTEANEGHHGDCVGADEQFHTICHMAGVLTVVHPPEDDKLRAYCKGYWKIEEERPYLVRNRVIVDTCDFLIAAPREEYEPAVYRGSGTWATIRYARRSKRRFRIVWP